MENMANLCVFCSSSSKVSKKYKEETAHLGTLIGKKKHCLIYGGGNVGLMGILARNVHDNGGKIIGIIPKAIADYGIVYKDADELIVTTSMSERKQKMTKKADAFIILPGGFGTLEELFEVLTLKQLQYESKAIVIVNINHFYDKMFDFFEKIFEEKFAKSQFKELYHVAENVDGAIKYITNYQTQEFPEKWYPEKYR
ncbi:MAG: TIGR00730 family Rossman fold protein [Candidatus Lokiarchaeota archaeon]|nr:TIGR00730 family Rossman fold protein [Candidatus Lokiarchaeota archaeon]